MSPKNKNWDQAIEYWKNLNQIKIAKFDKEINLKEKKLVQWLLGELLLKM